MGIFAAAVGVSLMLIAAQERPFHGEFAVRPDVLIQVMPAPDDDVSSWRGGGLRFNETQALDQATFAHTRAREGSVAGEPQKWPRGASTDGQRRHRGGVA
jgi:hypothetical protein